MAVTVMEELVAGPDPSSTRIKDWFTWLYLKVFPFQYIMPKTIAEFNTL